MTPAIQGIPSDVSERIVRHLSSHPSVEKVILFGSRAKGTHREGSDIDIALLGPKLTLADRDRLLLDYDRLYLPWKLDLILYALVEEPEFKAHIDRVGIPIFSR